MSYCGYDSDLISKGNCVVFICNGEGSVGYCNYMDRDFYASGDLILAYGSFLNPYVALYLTTILDLERPKYSFGRKYGKYVKNTTIPLPIDENKNPDWKWIELFVRESIIPKLPNKSKSVFLKQYNTGPDEHKTLSLYDSKWEWFVFGDLIDEPYKAKAHNANALNECSIDHTEAIQYITRTDSNNGCKAYVINEGFSGAEKGNAISIGDTTASIYYHANRFLCGDHMVIIRAPWMNKYTGLFIVALLSKEKFRYNYGRAFKKEIIKGTRIKLPVSKDGNPDWDFIEHYMRCLDFSANI